MKITILGSAAAEALPALFCECEICRFARIHKGKDLRRRTSYLLDGDTMIDFGPDAFDQTCKFDIDLAELKRILITHAHEDHLNPVDLSWRRQWFSTVTKNIDIIADDAVKARIERETQLSYEQLKLNERAIHPNETIFADDLEIFAVRGNHDPNSTPLNYVVTRNSSSVLIGNDTGYWSEESWDALAKYGKVFDIAIIESTMGFPNADHERGHLGVNATVKVFARLREMGLVTDKTRCVTNHFSHNGMPYHSKLEEFFNPHGIEVGFDGMVIEVS